MPVSCFDFFSVFSVFFFPHRSSRKEKTHLLLFLFGKTKKNNSPFHPRSGALSAVLPLGIRKSCTSTRIGPLTSLTTVSVFFLFFFRFFFSLSLARGGVFSRSADGKKKLAQSFPPFRAFFFFSSHNPTPTSRPHHPSQPHQREPAAHRRGHRARLLLRGPLGARRDGDPLCSPLRALPRPRLLPARSPLVGPGQRRGDGGVPDGAGGGDPRPGPQGRRRSV